MSDLKEYERLADDLSITGAARDYFGDDIEMIVTALRFRANASEEVIFEILDDQFIKIFGGYDAGYGDQTADAVKQMARAVIAALEGRKP